MALLPKNSSLTSGNMSDFAIGSLVMYENDNSPILACILDFKKGKYILLNQKAREIELAANRLYPFSVLIPQDKNSKDSKAAYMESLYKSCFEASEKISVEELWSLLNTEDKSYKCLELAQAYLGKPSLEQHISFRLALIGDKIFFKRRNDEFSPRPTDTVEQLKIAEAERKNRQDAETEAFSAFKSRLSDPTFPLPVSIHALVQTMEEIAAEASNLDAGRVREVRDFIHNFCEKNQVQLAGANHERVYNFLRLINHFDTFTNLAPIRHRLQVEHSNEVINEGKRLDPQNIIDEHARLDLTELDSFTIDDSSTKDMDDALSLEFEPNGYRLGIHISDVASAIPRASLLDKASSRRLTSLYFPDRIVNMLPEELSQDKISLVKEKFRPALSFIFEIAQDFKIIDCQIKLSKVKIKKRYDYEEVNTLLENPGEHTFEVLYNISATHEMQRIENGAIQLHKKEAYVQIRNNNELALQEIDENSPSRRLISELMIIANSHLASFAKENKIPFIYRTQEKPDREYRPAQSRSTESPSGDTVSRMNLKKSLNLTTPKPHAGLGMELYCQATSPIRRFLDICNQRQIVEFLRTGKPSYTEGELRNILNESDEDLQRCNVINKESKRFWLLKYLELHVFRKKVVQGTIIRTDLKTPLVELEEVFLVAPIKLQGKFSAGQRITMKIIDINPAFDSIKLEQVKP